MEREGSKKERRGKRKKQRDSQWILTASYWSSASSLLSGEGGSDGHSDPSGVGEAGEHKVHSVYNHTGSCGNAQPPPLEWQILHWMI